MSKLHLALLLVVLATSIRADEVRNYGGDFAGSERLRRRVDEAASSLERNVAAWLESNRALFALPDGGTMPEGRLAACEAVLVSKAWLSGNDVPEELRDRLSYDRATGAARVVYPEAPWRECRLVFVVADGVRDEAEAAVMEAALDFQIVILDTLLAAAAKRFLYEEYRRREGAAEKTELKQGTQAPLAEAFAAAARRFGPRVATGALPWNGNEYFPELQWAAEVREALELSGG